MTPVDERARRAGTNLRESFAVAPIPPAPSASASPELSQPRFGQGSGRIPRALGRGVVGGLAVACVGAGLLVWQRSPDEDQAHPPAVGAQPVPDASAAADPPVTEPSGTSAVAPVPPSWIDSRASTSGSLRFGLTTVPDGWTRHAGGPVGGNNGDSDFRRRITVLESGELLAIAMVGSPEGGQPEDDSYDGVGDNLADRAIVVADDGRHAAWTERGQSVELFVVNSGDEPGVFELTSQLRVDDSGFVEPVEDSTVAATYRGDISPWFAAVMSQPDVDLPPLDEVVIYRGPDVDDGDPSSFAIGRITNRGAAGAVVAAFAALTGGADGAAGGLTSGAGGDVRGWATSGGVPAGPRIEFAVRIVGPDAVIMSGFGLTVDQFDRLVADVASVGDEEWRAWVAAAPVDALGEVGPAGQAQGGSPRAVDDVAATGSSKPVVVEVLANDVDPDGDVLSIVQIVDVVGPGHFVIAGDTLRFTPDASARPGDWVEMSYVVSDPTGATATGRLKVMINDATDDAADDTRG